MERLEEKKKRLKKRKNELINIKRDEILKFYYDDIKLADEFIEEIENFKSCKPQNEVDSILKKYYRTNDKMYPLQTKMDFEISKLIAKNFFKTIDYRLEYFFKEKIKDKQSIKFGENPHYNINGNIELTNYGDLRDLYTMVHEFSHYFDSKNGKNSTKLVLTETCAQSMERLLDNYLLNLNDDELAIYNIDKSTLLEDINDRKIATFLSRYKLAEQIRPNNQKDKNYDRSYYSKYLLAQIYSHFFSQCSYNEKKEKIVELIKAIKNDDLAKALLCFNVSLYKDNKEKRENINQMLEDLYSLNKPNAKKIKVILY